MENKGLTMSIIFEASSANYGEGLGNITSLKKITRGDGESYTYISRQALRYNIVQQMGIDNTKLGMDKTVIQFHLESNIEDFAEIDLFGYMKTNPGKSLTRSAVVRLSNAISLESYEGDTDFLTNKGLFDRVLEQGNLKLASSKDEKDSIKGGNIAQSEIHKSFYAYTITIDLEKIGIDKNVNIEISKEKKAERIINLLNTIKFLYRDIKGRREDLKPLFVIGGVYSIKNPFFEGKLKLVKNKLSVQILEDIVNMNDEIKNNTNCALISDIFSNEKEIKEKLKSLDMKTFFEKLGEQVNNYYLQ